MPDYPHILSRVFNTPLCIHPDKAATVVSVLGPRLGMDADQVEQAAESIETSGNVVPRQMTVPGAVKTGKPYVVTDRGVAVVHVLGTLVHRAAAANPPSMMWSYPEIEDMVMDAATDPTIQGVMLDIDSAGGEANGVFDLSDTIRAARDAKPVWAVADENAFSAAYAIASGASRILLPRTGGVGSIGVIAMHLDISDKDQMEGKRYTTIFAGARKNDFNPHSPLTDEARGILQESVDRTYGLFVDLVARNRRNLSADAVRATEAGIFEGADAVGAGLADAVLPFKDALTEFTEHLDQPNRAGSIQMAASADADGDGKKEGTMTDANKPAADAAKPAEDAGTEKPETETATDDNVVNLDAARSEGREQATEIVNLCAIAGMPERASEYLAAGLTPATVSERLLAEKAEADSTQTDGQHLGGNESHAPKISGADIYRKRNAKHGSTRLRA